MAAVLITVTEASSPLRAPKKFDSPLRDFAGDLADEGLGLSAAIENYKKALKKTQLLDSWNSLSRSWKNSLITRDSLITLTLGEDDSLQAEEEEEEHVEDVEKVKFVQEATLIMRSTSAASPMRKPTPMSNEMQEKLQNKLGALGAMDCSTRLEKLDMSPTRKCNRSKPRVPEWKPNCDFESTRKCNRSKARLPEWKPNCNFVPIEKELPALLNQQRMSLGDSVCKKILENIVYCTVQKIMKMNNEDTVMKINNKDTTISLPPITILGRYKPLRNERHPEVLLSASTTRVSASCLSRGVLICVTDSIVEQSSTEVPTLMVEEQVVAEIAEEEVFSSSNTQMLVVVDLSVVAEAKVCPEIEIAENDEDPLFFRGALWWLLPKSVPTGHPFLQMLSGNGGNHHDPTRRPGGRKNREDDDDTLKTPKWK